MDYQEHDIDLSIVKEISKDALSDDALCRAWDVINPAGSSALLGGASFSALVFAFVPPDQLPADTTPMSFYGRYQEGCRLQMTRIYSKDHHPDLKQIIVGRVTAHGAPLAARLEGWNHNGKSWNVAPLSK